MNTEIEDLTPTSHEPTKESPALAGSAGVVDPDKLDLRSVPVRPLCARCRRRITIDTDADDDLWREVIGPKHGPGYICADCFTREADERMIDWTDRLRFQPYSMARQVEIQKQSDLSTQMEIPARGASQFPNPAPKWLRIGPFRMVLSDDKNLMMIGFGWTK